MNLEIQASGDERIVRVQEEKLTFDLLRDFSAEMSALVDAGARNLVIDLSAVNYMDSPAFGCLADILLMMCARNGNLKLVGLQKRVKTMANLSRLTHVIDTYCEEKRALRGLSNWHRGLGDKPTHPIYT